MAGLKLSKLPDRTPVKIVITVAPDLKAALDDYAALYGQTYTEDRPATELIPEMLWAFLESDRVFQQARREGRG